MHISRLRLAIYLVAILFGILTALPNVLPPRVLAGHLPIRCKALKGARVNWMRRCSGLGGF